MFKITKLSIASFFTTSALLMSAAANAAEIKIVVPADYAPFGTVEGDSPKGAILEPTVAALKAMGHTVKYEVAPFSRLYYLLEKKQMDVGIGVMKNPERLKSARFSDPVMKEYNLLLAKKGKSFKVEGIADLKGKKLGTRLGFAYPKLDGKPGITLEAATGDDLNMNKLQTDRIDAMIVGSVRVMWHLEKDGSSSKVEPLAVSVGEVPLGVAFSMDKFTDNDIKKFNEEVKKFKESPEYSKMLERFGISKLVKEWPLIKE